MRGWMLAGLRRHPRPVIGTLARAVTGTAVPCIPAVPAALIVTTVAALAFGTIMATFAAVSCRTELA